MLKKIFTRIVDIDNEKSKVIHFVQQYADKLTPIIDIGCGYGRLMSPIQAMGYPVIGVEKNQTIIDANQRNGLVCMNVTEFEAYTKPVKMMVLSHIIEHFTPTDLMTFLNQCLDKLDKGGYLVIATPLHSPYFYDDFDHVKPYHPTGLQMVFGGKAAQVQYYSPHQLALKDLWFRRSAFFSTLRKSSYLKTPLNYFYYGLDFTMALLFRLSGGMIGRKDGWVGVFRKC